MLELEAELERAQRKVEALERRAGSSRTRSPRLERRRDEVRADLVRYQAGGTDIVRRKDLDSVKLRVERGD